MEVTPADGTTLVSSAAGDGETVAFVGDAGYGAWQWGWQHAALTGPFETIVYDHRGTGRSDAPPGPYSVETLADDLETVLRAHDARNAHLVGAGLGGMVALDYARRYSRARSLCLLCTAATGENIDTTPLAAPRDDPVALRDALTNALSAEFFKEQDSTIDQLVEWRTEDATPDGWAAQQAAIEGFDAGALYELTLPALVCHGTADAVWPVSGGEQLAEGLPKGEFFSLDGAGHLCHVEHSRVVNDELLGFLEAR
ncbi:alpha/beta hydrolase [Haladaptatus sp. DJG-WS-42]|uniref:alpha/beta fold hydrolase n=1 Tax=Haladaptatus sp. DJG-WS-42 TaxID=3120516 RepID=UPI0030D2D130